MGSSSTSHWSLSAVGVDCVCCTSHEILCCDAVHGSTSATRRCMLLQHYCQACMLIFQSFGCYLVRSLRLHLAREGQQFLLHLSILLDWMEMHLSCKLSISSDSWMRLVACMAGLPPVVLHRIGVEQLLPAEARAWSAAGAKAAVRCRWAQPATKATLALGEHPAAVMALLAWLT